MSFIDRIKSWFGGPSSQKSLPALPSGQPSGFGQIILGGTKYQGAKNRTHKEVLDTYVLNPDLRKVIDVIALTASTAEPYVTVRGKENLNHELNGILARPNPYHTWSRFCQLSIKYLVLLGEVYILKRQGLMGTELWPIPPHKVFIADRDKALFDVLLRGSDRRDPDAELVEGVILGQDLVRIMESDLRDPYLESLGWGETLGAELDISEFAATHEATYLKNMAIKDIILNIPGLTPEKQREMLEMWRRTSGPQNSGKPRFLGLDAVDAIELSGQFDPGSLIELRKHSADVVREALGVPREVLGDNTTSNRATSLVADFLFKKNCVQPRIDFFLEELTIRVLPIIYGRQGSRDLAIEAESIVPADKAMILDVIKVARETVTINEVRELIDKEPIEGGDVLLSEMSNEDAQEAVLQVPVEETRAVVKYHRPLIPLMTGGSRYEQLDVLRLQKELEEDTNARS